MGEYVWKVQCAKQNHRREYSRMHRTKDRKAQQGKAGHRPAYAARIETVGILLMNAVSRLWQGFLSATIGYGYRPVRVLTWVGAILVIATILVGPLGMAELTPAKTDAAQPAFNPFLYSLDLLLPVANLGIKNSFVPHGSGIWVVSLLTLSGWLLATVIVAGLAGVFKHD
jgi:hypothetical protein